MFKINSYNFRNTKYFFLIGLLVIVTVLSLLFLFFHSNYREHLVRQRLLTNNYYRILELSQNQISKVLNQLNTSIYDPQVTIVIDNHTLNACYKKQCRRYSLFKLVGLLENVIPEYIDFKVELNGNIVHFRGAQNKYDFENLYPLNDQNQLFISTAIDKEFWKKEQSVIRQPYWILSIILFLNLTIIYWIFRYLFKIYVVRYDKIHNKKSRKKEEALLKKIWDLQYQRKEEAKLHYLFARKANKLVSDNSKNSKNFELLPCSIVLQQENIGKEEVDLNKVINMLLNIFAFVPGNLAIIKSSESINFESQEFFYQIIYSILSYLFFIFPEANIKLHINSENDELMFLFTVSEADISSEKGLCKYSHKFFKYHANMFILDIAQVFHILRNKNFGCDVIGDGKILVIKLTQNKREKADHINSNNNVIPIKLGIKK